MFSLTIVSITANSSAITINTNHSVFDKVRKLLFLSFKITITETVNANLEIDCGYKMPNYTYLGYVLFGQMPSYNPNPKYVALRFNNRGTMYFASESGSNWKLGAGEYYVNQMIKLW